MAVSLLFQEIDTKLRKRRSMDVPAIDNPAFHRNWRFRMESVERVIKYPVVGDTLKIASRIYSTVKVRSFSLISN
jgi:hypothetical protein